MKDDENHPPVPARQSVKSLVILLLLFITIIAATGYFYFQNEKEQLRQTAGEELGIIADMMVRQVAHWREERFASANRILEASDIANHVKAYFANTNNETEKHYILDWMAGWHKHYRFSRVLLFDTNQQAVLAVPAEKNWVGPTAKDFALRASHTNKILVSDLHLSRMVPGTADMDVFMPLIGSDSTTGDRKCAGVLMFEINPHEFLYPTLKSWPTPSRTAEAILVRKESNDVVFVTELRHRTNTALKLRLSSNKDDLPAAMAVQGKEGIAEGKDYRKVPVLAALRTITNSPWYVVAKEDQDEIYAPIRSLAWQVTLATGVLSLLAVLGVGMIWHQQNMRFARQELHAERQHLALARELAVQEKARQESERKFRVLFDHIQDGILVADADKKHICFGNPAIARMLGYAERELAGLSVADIHIPADLPRVMEHFEKLATETASLVTDIPLKRKDGSIFYVDINATIIDLDGNRRLLGVFRDISERKQTEAKIMASLEEKTVLLKEVHHRVKNNLQIIISLLNLQADHIKNPHVLEPLHDMRNRVRSMALLHESLYRSGNFAEIHLPDYVDGLCSHMLRTMGPSKSGIKLEHHIADISLSLDQAVPCGLIVNELMTNALKHAFPEGRKGRVCVDIRQSGEQHIMLSVSDDGVGLPPDLDFDHHGSSLGLQLVSILTRQLNGTAQIVREGGTQFQIIFKTDEKHPFQA